MVNELGPKWTYLAGRIFVSLTSPVQAPSRRSAPGAALALPPPLPSRGAPLCAPPLAGARPLAPVRAGRGTFAHPQESERLALPVLRAALVCGSSSAAKLFIRRTGRNVRSGARRPRRGVSGNHVMPTPCPRARAGGTRHLSEAPASPHASGFRCAALVVTLPMGSITAVGQTGRPHLR